MAKSRNDMAVAQKYKHGVRRATAWAVATISLLAMPLKSTAATARLAAVADVPAIAAEPVHIDVEARPFASAPNARQVSTSQSSYFALPDYDHTISVINANNLNTEYVTNGKGQVAVVTFSYASFGPYIEALDAHLKTLKDTFEVYKNPNTGEPIVLAIRGNVEPDGSFAPRGVALHGGFSSGVTLGLVGDTASGFGITHTNLISTLFGPTLSPSLGWYTLGTYQPGIIYTDQSGNPFPSLDLGNAKAGMLQPQNNAFVSRNADGSYVYTSRSHTIPAYISSPRGDLTSVTKWSGSITEDIRGTIIFAAASDAYGVPNGMEFDTHRAYPSFNILQKPNSGKFMGDSIVSVSDVHEPHVSLASTGSTSGPKLPFQGDIINQHPGRAIKELVKFTVVTRDTSISMPHLRTTWGYAPIAGGEGATVTITFGTEGKSIGICTYRGIDKYKSGDEDEIMAITKYSPGWNRTYRIRNSESGILMVVDVKELSQKEVELAKPAN